MREGQARSKGLDVAELDANGVDVQAAIDRKWLSRLR